MLDEDDIFAGLDDAPPHPARYMIGYCYKSARPSPLTWCVFFMLRRGTGWNMALFGLYE